MGGGGGGGMIYEQIIFWVLFGKRDIESLNNFLACKLLFFSLINRTRYQIFNP